MAAFTMTGRANQFRVVAPLLITLFASAALAQVRGVPIHTGGSGIGPLGGAAGASASIARDPLGTSLKVQNLTTRSFEPIRSLEPITTPNRVIAAEPAQSAYSYESASEGSRVASLPSYNDEYSNASGSPPPPPEEPTDGDDGGDDDDDDDDEEEEDEEGDEAKNEVYSLGSVETQAQSPQQEPAPKKFPWGRVVVGVIVTICVLGYFSRND
jgi:hypothetical protein